MIIIKSKKAGFRRCGLSHPAAAVSYPDDQFTAAQLAVLKAEPMLLVEIVQEKADDSGIEAMTVEKLKEAILALQPEMDLKGIKKADLVEILKTKREAAGSKE